MDAHEPGTRTGRESFRNRFRLFPCRDRPGSLHEHSDRWHDKDRRESFEDRCSSTIARRQGPFRTYFAFNYMRLTFSQTGRNFHHHRTDRLPLGVRCDTRSVYDMVLPGGQPQGAICFHAVCALNCNLLSLGRRNDVHVSCCYHSTFV